MRGLLPGAQISRQPYVPEKVVKLPIFDWTRSDPRFQDLLRRLGLPQ